jgi:hypoxanthine phosphoribosyltransferase
MLNEDDKRIIKRLQEDKAMLDVLRKIFVVDEIISRETLSKTNEEIGEIVRANTKAKQTIEDGFNRIKNLTI